MFDDDTMENVASNVRKYYKKLNQSGLPSTLVERIVQDYHQMIMATVVLEPTDDDDTVLSA